VLQSRSERLPLPARSLVTELTELPRLAVRTFNNESSAGWLMNSSFCGLLRRVVWWLDTDVSEDRAASIFRVEILAFGESLQILGL